MKLTKKLNNRRILVLTFVAWAFWYVPICVRYPAYATEIAALAMTSWLAIGWWGLDKLAKLADEVRDEGYETYGKARAQVAECDRLLASIALAKAELRAAQGGFSSTLRS